MKTILNITTIMLLSICFFSCSKDDDNTAEPKVKLLTKTIDPVDNLIANYTYNDAGQLTNFSRNSIPNNPEINLDFTYNTDGTLAQTTNVSDGTISEKYFYDANKKLIKKEGRNGTDITTYEYSANTVTKKYIFTPMASGYNDVYKFENGNAVEVKEYSNVSSSNPNGTLSTTLIYTYDDKFRATTSLPKEYLFPENYKNNILTAKYNSEPVYNYVWEYNAAGYPTKRTTSFVRTYEYQ